MGTGLVMVKLGAQEEQAPIDDTEGQAARAQSAADSLGMMLARRFEEWATAREEVEEYWLKDMRAYCGVHEPGGTTANDVFVNLTRTKTQSAYARIVDLLFQSSDKHWGIEATPESEVPAEVKMLLAQQVMMATGQEPADDEIATMVQILAEERVKRMERRMADQMADMRYEHHLKTALLEMCIIGTGVVRGVTVGSKSSQYWASEAGQWGIKSKEIVVPDLKAVSAFDMYPDPYATCKEDMLGVFERAVLTPQQFETLKGHPKILGEVVENILAESPEGNYTPRDHERDLRTIAGYSIDTIKSRRFEILKYWGVVSGGDLAASGFEQFKDAKEGDSYQVNIWVCGSRTILARMNPMKPEAVPYHFIPYERVPHQFWGVGVPRSLRDSQATLNGTVNNLLDNMSVSAGPMVEVNMDILKEGEDPRDIRKWRTFLREGGDPSAPLLRFYQAGSNINELSHMIDIFRRFADDESGLPSYTHGTIGSGMNKTASGMSMLMGQANVFLKAIIKNIDDYGISSIVKSLYHWNMRWSDDETIKGDMNVVARASSVLVAKEVQSERILRFLQMTANPLDAPMIERAQLLRDAAESMDMKADKVVKTDEELEALAGFGSGVGVGLGDPPA